MAQLSIAAVPPRAPWRWSCCCRCAGRAAAPCRLAAGRGRSAAAGRAPRPSAEALARAPGGRGRRASARRSTTPARSPRWAASARAPACVIGDDGLVLTIGYLILEAEHVDLVDRRRARACRRAWWPTTWRPASACCRRWRRCAWRRCALGRSAGAERRRAADGRQRRRRRRAEPGAAGVAARLLGLLGVPHRRRAVHRAAAHRPQRRGAVQPATANCWASARWW